MTLNEKNLMMTNLETKIQEQLRELNICPEKHLDKLSHLTADYIELQSLFSADSLSHYDILSIYYDEGIRISAIKKEDELGLVKAEENDNDEIWIKEQFQTCEYRAELLLEDYPFAIDKKTICLKQDLTEKQKLYILLLLASNLNYLNKLQSVLTTDFERISYEVLKSYLPNNAIVKQFGKNSDYIGNAKEKIKGLAEDLNIRCNENLIEETSTGNQERGLDVIGWVPFNDEIPNLLTILGQCACGKEWYKKQFETKRYENYYIFHRKNPIHSMFIPYGLVKNSSSFYQSDELIDNLLFERFRIMENLKTISFYDELDSKLIVENCINFKECII